MSIAAQGYNLNELAFDPSKWKMDKNPMDGGYLFRVESGVGFSHKRDKREGWEKSTVANRFNAKAIELSARQGDINLTHTDLTSRDAHGHRIEGSQISLNARDGINYHGGENLRYYKGRQQSSGVEVGTAFSVGAKMGWSFYVQAGFNQGKQDREGQIVQNSLVDTEHLIINSGNPIAQNQQMAPTYPSDVNLSAVTAKAKSITTNIDGRLNIESRQSHEKERESSHGGGIHLEGGYGSSWNASVNVNAAKGKSERHQVLEQAGLFAEEGGYHITADRVHLKGSAIASTNPTNSRLQTNTLTFEDIQNYSSSQAISAGMGAGYGQKEGEAHPNMSPGVPMSEREHDHTTTKATLTEGTILLNKDTTPVLSTALELGINTDLSQANNQTDKPKDINKALSEQQQIATAVGHMKSAVENYIKNQRKAAETEVAALEKQQAEAKSKGNQAQIDKLEAQLNTAKQRRNDWGTSGTNKRITDTVTNILTTAIAGAPTEAIATTAISPWINQEIKRLTTNKTTGKVDKTTNAIAHAVWGAIEAASAKGNATAGAVAGASSELAAPLIAKALYGTDDPKQLTEVQKQNIVNLSSLAGAIGAGIANGNGSGTEVLTSANQGAEIGKRAVENNYLSIADVQDFIRELSKAQKEGRDTKPILEKYKGISEENRQQLIACKGNVACETAHLHEMNTGAEELERNLGFFSRMTVSYPNDLNTANRIALSNLVERENAESFSKLSDTTKFGLNAMEAGTAIGLGAAAGSAKVGLSKLNSLISGKNKAYPTSGMDGYKRANVGDSDYRSSGAENVALYPKLKEQLFKENLSNISKINNIRGLEYKPLNSTMLIPEFRNQLAQAKGSLPKTLHGAGNAAIAKVEIEGLDTKTLAAHSRINLAQNGFIGNGKSQFNALVIPNNRGIDINRAVDSEYKIFSNVSDLLGNRYNAKGNLTIFTERHACKSCLGVADQFKKQYPNINIYIFDNNGSVVIPK